MIAWAYTQNSYATFILNMSMHSYCYNIPIELILSTVYFITAYVAPIEKN